MKIKNTKTYEYEELDDEKIIEFLYNSHGKINGYMMALLPEHYIEWIKNRYPKDEFVSIKNSVWRIKLGIEECPRCIVCGVKVPKLISAKQVKKYCSRKCSTNDNQTKENAKKTCLERYGVQYFFNSDKFKKESLKTTREKYGVDNVSQNETIKKKKRETCMKNFGADYPYRSKICMDKMKKTMTERYGVENASYIPGIVAQRKETNTRLYGDKTWGESKIGRSTLSYIVSSEEVQRKIIETKKANGTTNSSEPERKIEDILREKFTDLKTQYNKDDRYPFACDFYIPSLDLFIEYQGTWTHGFHVFDPNNEDDINTINEWKSKSEEGHVYYTSAIKTWTVSDPKKRDYVKKNNLNYIEFWNLEEVRKWIENEEWKAYIDN